MCILLLQVIFMINIDYLLIYMTVKNIISLFYYLGQSLCGCIVDHSLKFNVK